MTTKRFATKYGDTLEINWNGSVHVAQTTGAQFVFSGDAMREEIAEYLKASGEHVDDAAAIDLDVHGHWID